MRSIHEKKTDQKNYTFIASVKSFGKSKSIFEILI